MTGVIFIKDLKATDAGSDTNLYVDITFVLKQNVNTLHVLFVDGNVQCATAATVQGIDISAMLQQEFGYLWLVTMETVLQVNV